jgi:Raf kinase inhibitor-like YbhB/YbcL family protein
MWRPAGLLALSLMLTGCGSAGEGKDNRMNDSNTVARFGMSSGNFNDGQPIPLVHSCDGSDQSPALAWDDPPSGTRSLALVVDDPDAPSGTFHHWGAYDIPPATRSIASGQAIGKQALNDGGKGGYMGPCPPKGHGPHHYRFKLYALDVDALALPADAKVEQVEAEAQKHQVAMAQLMGTYERK